MSITWIKSFSMNPYGQHNSAFPTYWLFQLFLFLQFIDNNLLLMIPVPTDENIKSTLDSSLKPLETFMKALLTDSIGLISLVKPFTRFIEKFQKNHACWDFSNNGYLTKSYIVLNRLHVIFLVYQDQLHLIHPYYLLWYLIYLVCPIQTKFE